MHYTELETPALLIEKTVMENNIKDMQNTADKNKVSLRPHTKTHKMSTLARMQTEAGASGITVAKVGEAEVMASEGLGNIFIANEIVGEQKLARIRKLAETIDISFGIDSIYQVQEIESVFEGADKKAQVLVEIEVGEKRSGVIEEAYYKALLEAVVECKNLHFIGVFSHDGHTYKAETADECKALYEEAAKRTIHFAELASETGLEAETVSIGSTPPFILNFEIPEGVTEIRPGTYILMDAGQSNVIGHFDRAAATVLTTIISKPTRERVITDVGAKGITMQSRSKGITATEGLGRIRGFDGVHIDSVFDEHAIIYNEAFSNAVEIGDKVRIIPNHICPVANLHETAYLIDNDEVVEAIDIDCRGKLK
ncbi:alanine racemase [Salinicoccus sp. HZC-1]|uniref:alanine racemase n=1 Tax=Salinicoccus sp. HZC-1 TaxID=3385497 RepID=UPI00398A7D67